MARGYRYTKNYVITPKGLRIHKKEYDFFQKQVRSINYGLGRLRDMTKDLEKPTYRKYPQSVYSIPKNVSASIGQFSNIEEFREQLYKNEILRNEVVNRPRAINQEMNLKITNKLMRRARRDWRKKLKSMKFLDKRNKQYKDNMITSIKDVFSGTEYEEKLIDELNSMTEEQFVDFWRGTPYEVIFYVYSNKVRKDDKKFETAYNDIMQYVERSKSSFVSRPAPVR